MIQQKIKDLFDSYADMPERSKDFMARDIVAQLSGCVAATPTENETIIDFERIFKRVMQAYRLAEGDQMIVGAIKDVRNLNP